MLVVLVIHVLQCAPSEAEQVILLPVGTRLVVTCKDRYCKQFARGEKSGLLLEWEACLRCLICVAVPKLLGRGEPRN